MEKLNEIAEVTFSVFEGQIYAECSEQFPSIFFLIDGYYVEVAAKDYVIDVSEDKDRSICLIQISKTDSPFLIIGMPLFVDYTTVFDDIESFVIFLPTEGSEKQTLERGSIPRKSLRLVTDIEASDEVKFIGNLFGNIAALIIIAIYVFLLY